MINGKAKKKWLICRKPDSWLTNYSASKVEQSEKKIVYKYPDYEKNVAYKCQFYQYLLDFKGKNLDDSFAQYFKDLCIITKTPKKAETAKANSICKMYYKNFEKQEYQVLEKL